MTELQQCFFNIYQMDYQFGWYNKDQMKNLVVQGFLSAENYQKIIGEAYVAPQAQPAQQTVLQPQPAEPEKNSDKQ